MVDASKDEALLAVDLYNQSKRPRRLEAFFVHMHLAWLYLLHARFRRDGVDYRPYAFEWGERVRSRGGLGRLGQVTPPACSSTRSR